MRLNKSGVADSDQGAASGLVNADHQLGGTLGLGILVVVFAGADASLLKLVELLSHRLSAAMTDGGIMLIIAQIIIILTVMPVKVRTKVTLHHESAGYRR